MSMEWIRQSWLDTLALTADWMRTEGKEFMMDTMLLAFHNVDDLSEIVRLGNVMIGNAPDDDNPNYTVSRILHFQVIPQNGKFDVVFLVEVRYQMEVPDWVKQEN